MKKYYYLLLFMLLVNISYVDGFTGDTKIKVDERFPLPESLKSNVEFWIRIYARYKNNEVVIHDNRDLSVIYEVIDTDKIKDGKDLSDRQIWNKIEDIKGKYEQSLTELGMRAEINPDILSEFELSILKKFKNSYNPADYRNAAKHVRAQKGLKEHFRDGLIRSGKYTEYIKQVLRTYGIPEDIKALPHVESSFNVHAYSKFGAAGLWQFTRGTGRLFLDINYSVDQRLDPELATIAAAKLLKRNYDILGTWPLALTAYNHGTNGLKRAIRKLRTTDIGVITSKYSSRNFKFASRNFYAEFLAARHVSENYRHYFGDLEFEQPLKYHKVKINNYLKITTIANALELSIDAIHEYNPSLRSSVLSAKRRIPRGFELKLPWQGDDFDPSSFWANIPITEKKNAQIESNWYRVQPGDNLKSIARRAGTTVDEIMALNDDIFNIHKIYINQIIRLPERDAATFAQAVKRTEGMKPEKPAGAAENEISGVAMNEKVERNDNVSSQNIASYTIAAGDNLENIASRFGTTVEEIIIMNNIKDKNTIVIGQEIKLVDDVQLPVPVVLNEGDSISELLSEDATFDSVRQDEMMVENLVNAVHGPSLEELMQEGGYQRYADKTISAIDSDSMLIKETSFLQNDEEMFPVVSPKNVAMNEKTNTGKGINSGVNRYSDIISDRVSIQQVSLSNPDSTIGKIFVLPDETLGHYADWLEIPTQKIRRWNGLSFYRDIQLGMELTLYFNKVKQKTFMQRRLEFMRSIEEDFYQTFFVDGVQLHRLRQGESVWELANAIYEIPYWLIIKYNPGVNLNDLRTGDEIIIPIIRTNKG